MQRKFTDDGAPLTIEHLTRKGHKFLPRLRSKAVGQVLRCEILSRKGLDGMDAANSPPSSVHNTEQPDLQQCILRVGDHVLVLARVVEVLQGSFEENRLWRDKKGLSYLDGKYRRASKTHIGRLPGSSTHLYTRS